MKGNRVILAAHRGEKKYHPENTMPAFVAALEAGVDMIETDIHQTADGELVIIHDRSALRTAGVDRFVTDMTLAEVRQLDVGGWMAPEFVDTGVLTVREFMEWIRPTHLLINWELKDYPGEVGEEIAFSSADKLLDLIDEYGLADRSMVNSFSNQVLEHIVGKVGHKVPVHGQGIHKVRRTKDEVKTPEEDLFDWCCMYPNELGHNPVEYPENFAHCVENGILPCVCIPDLMETYEKAISYGCKMFTSNDIYAATEVLNALGVR